MSALHLLCAGILLVGSGCSKLDKEHPLDAVGKCKGCHETIPPDDVGKVWEKDSTVMGLHSTHLSETSTAQLKCSNCHYNYDSANSTWNISETHRTDSLRYDSAQCAKCHTFNTCQNAACHLSPPLNKHPVSIKNHRAHVVRKGYKCGVCHKGYDLDKKIVPTNHDKDGNYVEFDLRLSDGTLLPVAASTPPAFATTGTCSFIYCHGSSLAGGKKAVSLSETIDTTGNAKCSACHNIATLSTEVFEHSREGHSIDSTFYNCILCHNGYSLKYGATNDELHINGKIDLDNCLNCHVEGIPSPFTIIDGVIQRIPQHQVP